MALRSFQLHCCGVREVHGLEAYPDRPADALRDIVLQCCKYYRMERFMDKSQKAKDEGYPYGVERYRRRALKKPSFVRFSAHVIFTQAIIGDLEGKVRYGDQLRDHILKLKLGSVGSSDERLNPNYPQPHYAPHRITIYTWTPDEKRLMAYAKKVLKSLDQATIDAGPDSNHVVWVEE